MSTNKYHRIIKRTRRFLNFAKYVKYLKHRYYDAPLPAVDFSLCFLFNKCQSQVHQASTCQNWFIKQMNENTDEEDRFIFAGLIPREEVSRAGALQVHTQMNEKLHLLYPTSNYNYSFQQTAKNVRIHQYGDVLSDINFSRIGSHIQKNLSKIGYKDYVKELMGAFDCYTMTHGYFHENMHRVHCIMQESYGGLLQPIQVLWQVKRVSANILKNGRFKDHEEY